MRLTMKERKAVTAKMRERYGQATKKQKGQLLDELVALTGYNRWYAVELLSGRRKRSQRPLRQPRQPRQRRRVYDEEVLTALKRIWVIMDCICGKRLAAVLPELVRVLEQHGELALPPELRHKLLAISAAKSRSGPLPSGIRPSLDSSKSIWWGTTAAWRKAIIVKPSM
jgi:hypothetical protein